MYEILILSIGELQFDNDTDTVEVLNLGERLVLAAA